MTTNPAASPCQFTTDLWLPVYRDGGWGHWSLRTTLLAGAWGY
ncbi:hypothetical protein [Sphingomonas sp.]|nr:hypothetical protein [Sphingomonas sp.]